MIEYLCHRSDAVASRCSERLVSSDELATRDLLIALCAVTTYGVVIVAHGRSLFPDHLAGRGVTTVNLAQVFGTTALPILTGWVIGEIAQGQVPAPELAYRLAFGAIALCLATGLSVYLFARDLPPRS